MNGRRNLCIAIGLATAPAALPALAQQQEAGQDAVVASGLTELSDAEMGDMRGRYTVSSNTVAWFCVTMVSTWQTQDDAQLQSRLTVTMDASRPGKPQVTFQPHVSITAIDAPPPVPDGQRSIDSSGLANVTGVVQGVQVAGDGNVAHNVARITVRDRPSAQDRTTATPGDGSPAMEASTVAVATVSGMNAVARIEENAARVLLRIDGQGAVEQWIGSNGMGQTIQLAADGQKASNWMELDVVRNTTQGRTALGQNVAQAIALSRGIAVGY